MNMQKIINVGFGIVIFGLWSTIGALIASIAGSPIIAKDLILVAVLSMFAGVSMAAIAEC